MRVKCVEEREHAQHKFSSSFCIEKCISVLSSPIFLFSFPAIRCHSFKIHKIYNEYLIIYSFVWNYIYKNMLNKKHKNNDNRFKILINTKINLETSVLIKRFCKNLFFDETNLLLGNYFNEVLKYSEP